jgi:DNA repair protein RecN (Recombination protein N)
MLSLLHIENIAVIEAADIQFDRGFNVLTGETGAGKSIVIDAIGAIIGERTSRDLIRTGAKSAQVSAVFTALPDLSWFRENGMGPDGDGNLLLQREIQPDGKNVCRLGGRPITVSQLRSLGQQLLNIHGQHDGQQLLDPEQHLGYLDRFGETEPLLEDYQAAFRTVSELRREIAALEMDEAEKSRRIDSLNYQIRELERAELKPGEDVELNARKDVLRNAGKLIEAVEGANFALSGDEDTTGAVALIIDAENSLHSAARVSDQVKALAGQLAEVRATAADLAEQIRDLRDTFDVTPDELDQLETRLDVIYRLKKKYGDTVEEMLAYLDRCRKELDEIQCSTDTIERLKKKLAAALATAKKKAVRLSDARKKAAVGMQERIQSELSQLDMPKVRFLVDFAPKGGELGLDETGMDQVQFLMSANVGEDLKPIHKIASGGELARIMLALKNVLAENDDVSTLIFDEVDTGVSGRAAQKVAEKMADIAGRKQVLCVTHLPQIAAMADTHFSVEKGERKGRTYTQVERLSRERRVEELSRLTSGAELSDAIKKGAGELLASAERYKSTRKKSCFT